MMCAAQGGTFHIAAAGRGCTGGFSVLGDCGLQLLVFSDNPPRLATGCDGLLCSNCTEVGGLTVKETLRDVLLSVATGCDGAQQVCCD
eukprot:1824242-Prymnesium_polylepis.1